MMVATAVLNARYLADELSFGKLISALQVISMPRFEAFSNGQHIGWSDLELGDPPMGVAFGVFVPAPGYSSIQEQVRACAQCDQSHFNFTVRIVDGEEIRAAGVSVADYSADCGEDAIELSVLGIEYPAYGDVFPEHVAAYKRQLSS